MTQILLSETWENLRQIFSKPEVHVLGFYSLQTSNWDGDKSQCLAQSLQPLQYVVYHEFWRTVHTEFSWTWFPVGCRLKYSYPTFDIGCDSDATFSTSRDPISPSVRRGSLSLLCPCAQKSMLSSSHSPWLNARLLPSLSFILLTFRRSTQLKKPKWMNSKFN